MTKQALSFEDVQRTIAALELYAEILERESAGETSVLGAQIQTEAQETRVLIDKYAALYEVSAESSAMH